MKSVGGAVSSRYRDLLGRGGSLAPTGEQRTRVLYLNVTDSCYPRNRALRSALDNSRWKVVTIRRVNGIPYPLRCAAIFLQAMKFVRMNSVVVMSEFGNSYAWVSYLVAKLSKSVHVVDGFIGMHETHVQDRATYSTKSLKARAYSVMDRVAFRTSDLYLIDTVIRGKQISWQENVPEGKVLVVPVGAPNWAMATTVWDRYPNRLRILYYGNFTRLHSVDTVIRALPLVKDAIELDVLLIGDLSAAKTTMELVYALGLEDCVTFMDSLPESELRNHIHEADVVLGVFGDSVKAKSVIANKVWQGLCCGRYVLTQESVAFDEIRKISAPLLRTVDSLDRESVAKALIGIALEPPVSVSETEIATRELGAYARQGQTAFADRIERLHMSQLSPALRK
ncbi:glycosyltransferase [Rhodococcus sp. WS4]|nr:glycosyltransferase [Rhodococcus sp. WS4]